MTMFSAEQLEEDFSTRLNIARDPNTSADVLKILANDECFIVIMAVAEHPNTPAESLIELSAKDSFFLRDLVRQNPNTPEYIKEYLMVREYYDFLI